MQTSSEDGSSSPHGEAAEAPSAQASKEDTVAEAKPDTVVTKDEDKPAGEDAKEKEKAPEQEDRRSPPPARRGRSVAFSEISEPASVLPRREPQRVPSVRQPSPLTATPQRSGSFDFIRKFTTGLLTLPWGFFQSRPELRTWGADHLTDPSVQPRSPHAAHYGWGSLPNYPKSSLLYFKPSKPGKPPPPFYSLAPKGGYRPAAGVPYLEFVPERIQIPSVTPMGTPGYNWKDLKHYRMETAPYIGAHMTPADPSGMYVSGNYLVAYPYGVPAVEENEAAPRVSVDPDAATCKFLCWRL